MSLVDAFGREDRTEVKFSQFFALVKQAAQYEILMNAVNCDVPHRFIKETMTGKKETAPKEPGTVVTVTFDTEEFEKGLQGVIEQIEAKFGPAEDEAEQEQEATEQEQEAAEQEQENTEKEPPEVTAESILEAAEETTCRGEKGERNMVAVGIICFIAGAVAATVGLVAFGVHLANQNKQ